jgi:hypothetical protein
LALGVVSRIVYALPIGQKICYGSRSSHAMDCHRGESAQMSVYGETEVKVYHVSGHDAGYYQLNDQAKT